MANLKRENDNLQINNGNYTRIHNRILEELAKLQLSGHESRIIFALWRKTYGWQKKVDWISTDQFRKLTRLNKVRISETIARLKKRNLVTENRKSNRLMYGFNKHFTTWKKLQKNVTITENRNRSYGKTEEQLRKTVTKNREDSSKNQQSRVPKETLTKETLTKENIYTLFEYWNSLKIIIHRDVSKFKPHLNAALEKYSLDELKEAMFNYKTVLESDRHFWTYKWGLEEFLSRKNGVDKFLTVNNPLENFLKKGEKHAYTTKNEKTPKDWGFGLDRTKKNR